MRITFVLPDANMGGGTRVIALYASKLQRRGHRVVVVATPREVPTFAQRIKSWLRGEGWPDASPIGPSHFDFLDAPLELRTIDRWRPMVDSDVPDADVVVATWWETAIWVWAMSPAKGAKVHFMQDYETWGGPIEQVDASCRLPMEKIIIARWVGELLSQKFGHARWTMVPNSVDTDRFNAPPRGKQPVPTVGLTYTTFFNKGTDISLAALQLARQQVPQLRLISFGSHPVDPALPLPERSQFACMVPDHALKDHYARCDAWLFGTRKEGFGLPILEAMACRTPVIGAPAGAAPELIAQGGGMLIKPEDPADMARAIVEVCRLSEQRWRAMSDAAWATAHSYTWEDATDRFESVLRKVSGTIPEDEPRRTAQHCPSGLQRAPSAAARA